MRYHPPMVRSLSVALVLLAPQVAAAQEYTYLGPHPIDLAGAWDYDAGEHSHSGLMVGEDAFGAVDGVRLFLADPIAWGWDRDVWTYRGAHPLPGGLDGYCGIPGDHRHPFAPEGRFRRTDEGAHVYTGALRGGVAMVRPARIRPDPPIVTPPAIASPAPYWFDGCLYHLMLGSAGAFRPVPATDCRPGRHARSSGAGVTADSPAREGSWFDGNYGNHIRPERGRSSRPTPHPPQRD